MINGSWFSFLGLSMTCFRKPGPTFRDHALNINNLADCDELLQRRRERLPLAREGEALDPRSVPSNERHGAWRNAERARNEPDQRGICLAFARGHAYPRLEHTAPIGEHLDAVDCVAAATGREPDGQHEAARLKHPRPRGHRLKARSE